jgi:acetoin utilization protein AcuB
MSGAKGTREGHHAEVTMRVDELMTRSLVTVGHDSTVAEAWSLMRRRQVRHLPVLDGDRRLIGMITDHDLRQLILERSAQEEPDQLVRSLGRLRVNEVMTWAVITIPPDADIRHAARIMRECKLGALPVADGGRVVGMLTATDVIQAVAGMPGEGR